MAAVTLGAHFLYETIPECIARVSISETLDAGIVQRKKTVSFYRDHILTSKILGRDMFQILYLLD